MISRFAVFTTSEALLFSLMALGREGTVTAASARHPAGQEHRAGHTGPSCRLWLVPRETGDSAKDTDTTVLTQDRTGCAQRHPRQPLRTKLRAVVRRSGHRKPALVARNVFASFTGGNRAQPLRGGTWLRRTCVSFPNMRQNMKTKILYFFLKCVSSTTQDLCCRDVSDTKPRTRRV